MQQRKVVSWIYAVKPIYLERFAIRVLAMNTHGPTCFDDLKRVDGRVCATFHEAAKVHLRLKINNQSFSYSVS